MVSAEKDELNERTQHGLCTFVKYSRSELESTPPVLSTITAEDVAVPAWVLDAIEANEMPVPDPPDPAVVVGAAVANGGT